MVWWAKNHKHEIDIQNTDISFHIYINPSVLTNTPLSSSLSQLKRGEENAVRNKKWAYNIVAPPCFVLSLSIWKGREKEKGV